MIQYVGSRLERPKNAKPLRAPTLARPPIEQLLPALAPSQHGRRWRSLVCAVTRNEWHLREWLLRTLYVGVSHIVLVDDNHLGMDRDISELLAPLSSAGLLTHVADPARCGNECGAQKSWVGCPAQSNLSPAGPGQAPMPCARCGAGRRPRQS